MYNKWNIYLYIITVVIITIFAIDKVFGATLEYLTEKHGIESKFGAGNGNIRIPILIEKLISSMRGMGK